MTEQRYQVCRRRLTAAEFRQSARELWGIASQRHWVRDVAFAAEPCRARPGQAAAHGSVAPPPALTMLIRETTRPGVSMPLPKTLAG